MKNSHSSVSCLCLIDIPVAFDTIDQCFSNFLVLRTGNLDAVRPLVIKFNFKKIDVGGNFKKIDVGGGLNTISITGHFFAEEQPISLYFSMLIRVPLNLLLK